MSRPIVVTVCMDSSSESWEPYQPPLPWHSRAGGGAVHSINSRLEQLQQTEQAYSSITSSAVASSVGGTRDELAPFPLTEMHPIPSPANAARVRKHPTSALAAKTVMLLTVRDLRSWRD